MNKVCALLSLMLLSACSEMDMQGTDPKDYFAANPVANKVGHQTKTVEVAFLSGQHNLTADEIVRVQQSMTGLHPLAVEAVSIESSTPLSVARQASLMRHLGTQGVSAPVEFVDVVDLEPDHARINVVYAEVILPDCPNWKTSSITSYSNTTHGNMGCATTTNLGLMLADPRDLERGSSGGYLPPHTERSADAVTHYRHNMNPPAPQAPAGSAGDAAPSMPALPMLGGP